MTYYDEPSGKFHYPVRCDKHELKEYKYCEICMLRSQVQDAVDATRKETSRLVCSTNLAIHMIHDVLNKQQKEIDLILEFVNK